MVWPTRQWRGVAAEEDQQVLAPNNIDKGKGPIRDYGPVELGDLSEGLRGTLWELAYGSGGQVLLGKVGETKSALFTVAGASSFDLTFDTIGNPFVAFETASGVSIYWYDPQTAITGITAIAPGGVNPFCTLDLREPQQAYTTDVILTYERDNRVRYRISDDRFQVEYTHPTAELNGRRIRRAGVTVNNQYGFSLR